MARYAEDYAIFQQMYGVNVSGSESLIDGFNRSQRSFVHNGLIDTAKFAYDNSPLLRFSYDSSVGFVRQGFNTIRDLAGGAVDSAGYLFNELEQRGVSTPFAALGYKVSEDGEFLPQHTIGKAVYQLNKLNRQFISKDNEVAYYVTARLKTAGQLVSGMVVGTLQIPVDFAVGLVTGDGEKFGAAAFDIVSSISPAKVKGFNQRYGRIVTQLRNNIKQQGGLLKSLEARFKTADIDVLSKKQSKLRPMLSVNKGLAKFFAIGVENRDFDFRVRGLASAVVREVSKDLLKNGEQISHATVRKLGTILKYQEVIGDLLSPIRDVEGYAEVGNKFKIFDPDNAWRINADNETAIRFIAEQLINKELVGKSRKSLSDKGLKHLEDLAAKTAKGKAASQAIKSLSRVASAEDRIALRQVDELLKKHQYNLQTFMKSWLIVSCR